MVRRLRSTVYLPGDGGLNRVLLAGSVPSDEEAALITNPKAWETEGAVEAPHTEPPRGGAGATKEAWAAHAASLGVAVPDGASRDDIIAAVDARG